jgi:hypothetical protein
VSEALIVHPLFGSLWLSRIQYVSTDSGLYVEGEAWDDSDVGSGMLPEDYMGELVVLNFPATCINRVTGQYCTIYWPFRKDQAKSTNISRVRSERYERMSIRFWSKVQQGEPDECWPWLGNKSKSGYGVFHITDKRTPKGRHIERTHAHRMAFELDTGVMPKQWCVLHRCDNRLCCNPAHLFLGTKADNTADMLAKGRQSRGEQCYNSKLTADDVRQIRKAWRQGNTTQKALAVQYGVHSATINYAIHRRTWKHI